MTEQQKNNPLHGVKLEALLTELVDHYGFEILAEQININCFKVNPSIKSSLKFLRKTQWARDKVEAFYLYKYKHLPKPSDEQHELAPRERSIGDDIMPAGPAEIQLGEKEFFDDPNSGRKRKTERKPDIAESRRSSIVHEHSDPGASEPSSVSIEPKPDPWAKSREKNKK